MYGAFKTETKLIGRIKKTRNQVNEAIQTKTKLIVRIQTETKLTDRIQIKTKTNSADSNSIQTEIKLMRIQNALHMHCAPTLSHAQ